MKFLKCMTQMTMLLALSVTFAFAGSTTSSTTIKDGKKITTKVKTDNDGTTTTTVTTKEKDSTVTTTTTVADKDGNIISTDDPEARSKAAEAAKKKQDQADALAKAPKRAANDPIQMVLFQTVVSDQLKQATTKEGIFPYLRKEFENDPVIKIMDQRRVDAYAKKHDFKTGEVTEFAAFDKNLEFLPADIYVESFAALEEKVGINKSTNKLGGAPFLVYRAVITSEYSDKKWEVTEEGFILQNLEVTKNFANKIRDVILNQAGSDIPAQPEQFRRASEGTASVEGEIDAVKAFGSLFKKKKK